MVRISIIHRKLTINLWEASVQQMLITASNERNFYHIPYETRKSMLTNLGANLCEMQYLGRRLVISIRIPRGLADPIKP